MKKIKLVVWDLDEVFWKGTLSEEGVQIIESNLELVKTLTDRGIMNSIVSKNDFEQAKAKLTELGVWDYFIFPTIEWSPKGQSIKSLIDSAQLRDENVLFIDDNHLNLKEAQFYNPELHVKDENFIGEILDHEAFVGKDDASHSRLAQYRILEKKAEEKEHFSDNLAFLESSDIQIEIYQDLNEHKDRIFELLDRTNQLNYTKIRSSLAEISALLEDEHLECALIRAKDRYGDYGMVGFYSLDKRSNTLGHFVFSCRILNLGVAQYMYAKLKFPQLNIVPEVAETLDESEPHWITEVTPSSQPIVDEKSQSDEQKTKIFFKGGCDLSQMIFYLEGNNIDVQEETNYVAKNNFPIHQEHTQVLLAASSLSAADKDYFTQSENAPFVDERYFDTNVFDLGYDCLVYSTLMDYTQDLYLHKEKKVLLPLGGYGPKWDDPKAHDEIISLYQKQGFTYINDQQLTAFTEEYECVGQISPQDFVKNLQALRKKIPSHIPICFINGAEIDSPASEEKTAKQRHILMNQALDSFIENSENTYLVDVREIVSSPSSLTNNIRHYDRKSYGKIAERLLELFNQHLSSDIQPDIHWKAKLSIGTKRILSFFKKATRKVAKIFTPSKS